MKPASIEDFGSQFRVHDDEVSFRTCPVCNDSRWKVSVNANTGLWHCFTGACGAGGRVSVGADPANLLRLVAGNRRPKAEPPWSTWPEVTIDGAGNGLHAEGTDYLLQRGFSPPAAVVLYKVFSRPGEIIFPFFDPLGRPIYWSSRDITGTRQQKYINMPGRRPLYVPHFAGPPSLSRVPKIVVVEGILDSIRVHQAGFTAVAIGGTALPAYLREELLALADQFVIMLDSDAMAASIKLSVSLQSSADSVVVAVPRGTDPANLAVAKIQELLT
jgi:hypothetical protein